MNAVLEQVESGATFVVASILAVAGLMKLVDSSVLATSLERFGATMRPISWSQRSLRIVVRLVGVTELVAAAAFAFVRGLAGILVTGAVVAMAITFVGAVW